MRQQIVKQVQTVLCGRSHIHDIGKISASYSWGSKFICSFKIHKLNEIYVSSISWTLIWCKNLTLHSTMQTQSLTTAMGLLVASFLAEIVEPSTQLLRGSRMPSFQQQSHTACGKEWSKNHLTPDLLVRNFCLTYVFTFFSDEIKLLCLYLSGKCGTLYKLIVLN